MVFIDLQKAFDTVKRSILLYKLWQMGVRGTEYHWFRFSSYLSERISLWNVMVLRLICNLAATLFLIYINSFTDTKLKSKIFLYADDTALIYSRTNSDELQETINNDMKKIEKWMNVHHLTINVKKKQNICCCCIIQKMRI